MTIEGTIKAPRFTESSFYDLIVPRFCTGTRQGTAKHSTPPARVSAHSRRW